MNFLDITFKVCLLSFTSLLFSVVFSLEEDQQTCSTPVVPMRLWWCQVMTNTHAKRHTHLYKEWAIFGFLYMQFHDFKTCFSHGNLLHNVKHGKLFSALCFPPLTLVIYRLKPLLALFSLRFLSLSSTHDPRRTSVCDSLHSADTEVGKWKYPVFGWCSVTDML